jgi:nucleotide-binding universal stress UspA family protein
MPIVVAVDNSAGSWAAVQLAAHEARCRQTELLAVTAYRAERPVASPAGRPAGSLRTGQEERLAAEAQLRDTVTEALGECADGVLTRVVAGPAGKAIVDTARSERAELIVLAARPGLAVLPGTVSQYVLRNAGRPVMLVPAGGSQDGSDS